MKKTPIININNQRFTDRYWDRFIDSFEHIHKVIEDVEKYGTKKDKEYLNGLISNYGGPKRWMIK